MEGVWMEPVIAQLRTRLLLAMFFASLIHLSGKRGTAEGGSALPAFPLVEIAFILIGGVLAVNSLAAAARAPFFHDGWPGLFFDAESLCSLLSLPISMIGEPFRGTRPLRGL